MQESVTAIDGPSAKMANGLRMETRQLLAEWITEVEDCLYNALENVLADLDLRFVGPEVPEVERSELGESLKILMPDIQKEFDHELPKLLQQCRQFGCLLCQVLLRCGIKMGNGFWSRLDGYLFLSHFPVFLFFLFSSSSVSIFSHQHGYGVPPSSEGSRGMVMARSIEGRFSDLQIGSAFKQNSTQTQKLVIINIWHTSALAVSSLRLLHLVNCSTPLSTVFRPSLEVGHSSLVHLSDPVLPSDPLPKSTPTSTSRTHETPYLLAPATFTTMYHMNPKVVFLALDFNRSMTILYNS